MAVAVAVAVATSSSSSFSLASSPDSLSASSSALTSDPALGGSGVGDGATAEAGDSAAAAAAAFGVSLGSGGLAVSGCFSSLARVRVSACAPGAVACLCLFRAASMEARPRGAEEAAGVLALVEEVPVEELRQGQDIAEGKVE